jgi:hypothetical protein
MILPHSLAILFPMSAVIRLALALTLAFVLVITAPPLAVAQSQAHSLRDNSGRQTGTVTPTPGGGASIRDNSGRAVGTVVPTPGGGFAVRDNAGRRVGTVRGLPARP